MDERGCDEVRACNPWNLIWPHRLGVVKQKTLDVGWISKMLTTYFFLALFLGETKWWEVWVQKQTILSTLGRYNMVIELELCWKCGGPTHKVDPHIRTCVSIRGWIVMIQKAKRRRPLGWTWVWWGEVFVLGRNKAHEVDNIVDIRIGMLQYGIRA